MTPRPLLATTEVSGGKTLSLFQRGKDFMIVIDRDELMTTRMSGSEEALAEMTIERLGARAAPHILIGGYGMGFTLRAALAKLGPQARVAIVELVPAIIEWARGPMAALTAGGLDDPRTNLIVGDVAEEIRSATGQYDAILLDVDNGPDGLTQTANDRIYSVAGLRAAKTALKPDGILAIWSAAPDAAFKRRLGESGFYVDEVTVRARSNGKGPRFVIWFARPR
jgi:spermidine synthase